MLEIDIPSRELFDERTNMFVSTPSYTLQLEHSLISVSKWEAKWKKPFMTQKEKTHEELIDYVRCMTLNKNKVKPEMYNYIDDATMKTIIEYMNDSMTATTFREDNKKRPPREIVTAEIVYYWMIDLGIPFECQKWHLNKLMTLIRVCGIKNQSQKKMSKKDIYKQNSALNAARHASRGRH